MKKIISFALLLFFPFGLNAQTLSAADKAYQESDFATAKTQYEKIIPSATGTDLYHAQLRAAACSYSLGEFLNAAVSLYDYPLPQDPLWKARFLLYRIHMAQQVSGVYRPILNATQIESTDDTSDKNQWTRKEWQAQIDRDFRQLWALRDTLLVSPIEQENLILQLTNTDTQKIPTLFDFTVSQWRQYLQQNSTLAVTPLDPAHPSYLGGHARLKEGEHKPTALLISQLLAAAANAEGNNRHNARLFWAVDQLLQPLNSTAFVLENEEKARQFAADQLQLLSGKTTPKTSWWNRLKNYATHTSNISYGRSYAALELARLRYDQKQFPQSLEICEYAKQQLTPSYYTQQCAELAERITRVELSIQSDKPFNRQKPVLPFSGQNLHRVYARVYPTTFEELTQLYRAHYNRRTVNSWGQVTHLDSQDIPTFLSRTPRYEKSVQVTYEEVGKAQQGELTLPVLDEGFYVVLLSVQPDFDVKKDSVYGWVVNATDLAVFATAALQADPADYVAQRTAPAKTLRAPLFHIYAVDLKTGLPQSATSLQLITDWNGARENATTSQDGTFDVVRSVTVSPKENVQNTGYSLDVLATQGPSTAFAANRLYFHFYNNAPVQLFAQTDRPIYRPGQKVLLSAQALERLPRGLKTLGDKTVKFQITDPNGKSVFSASPRANALGTAQAEFTVPENNLLGTYSINVSLNTDGRTYHAYHAFRVEEYKRPDYELILDEPKHPLEYGKKAALSGTARYYMGTPLEKAKVTYTLKRKNYLPPFYWWWVRPFNNEEKIISQGQTSTDSNGRFTVEFTPTRQNEDEEFARYELEANVFDESGRTISSSRTYKISAHPHLLRVQFTQGFYDASKTAELAEIDLTDVEGKSVTGKLNLQIARLEDRQPTSGDLRCYNCTANTLDESYKDFAQTTIVQTQTLSFQKPGAQTVQLPALPEGVYRLTLSSEKAAKQSMVFVVAEEKSSLKLPDVALPQHATYYPGDKMRMLIGAGNLAGTKRVEIYQENQFLTYRTLLQGGAEIFTLPVTQNHRGGLALRWFGASDYVFHNATASVQVPFDNKQLDVRVNTPDTVLPGQKINWTLRVKDATDSAVNGLVNVTVYDKSLDYYAPNKPSLEFNQLYTQHTNTADLAASRQGPATTAYYKPSDHKFSSDKFSLLPLPTLNLQMMTRGFGRKSLSFGAAPMMAMAKADTAVMRNAAMQDMAMEEKATFDGAFDTAEAVKGAKETTSPDTSMIRTDFSETAYFNPSLALSGGKAVLQFTLPQTLTTWNLFGFALTPNGLFGAFNGSVLSRKDLMLRLQLPRFYREQDHGVIQAALTNQSAKKMTARVTLSVTQNDQNVLADFGITEAEKTVVLPPNTTQFVNWEITAPSRPDLYQITAIVRAGTQSDGEQKTLPVLPGKMRLLASVHTALKNGLNTLELSELKTVPATDVELTALTLNPSLALSVINSMPNLLSSPYKDLVSSLNRYVPLTVVHQFYTTYPQLKEAVKKLPKRTGRTASWNENDPLRLQLLEQTPWLRQAQGRVAKQTDIINLFDDKIVAAQLEKELKNITKLQNTSGAFTWFAGGPDDNYLTLYALQSFGEALAYQAKIAEAPAKKALRYIVPQIEKQLKQDENGSARTVAFALYAAYTLSAFPQTWPEMSTAKPYIKRWIDYADTQKAFMTPLGQIYAAAVYHRLGDDVKANAYLDLVLSRLKQDPLTGAYFAPEAQSWLWYNDTLSTQTVTLRTLLEMRPQSDKIAPMLQWLLFNRQVNDWTNTKAATQAVFTVLNVMQAQGALSQPSNYQLNWAGETKAIKFEPLDWTEDLQFVRTGAQVTPETYRAEITKESPQTDFASLNAVYRAHDVNTSPKGVINVSRAYFLRVKDGNETKLRPLTNTDIVRVGDEIEVHLTLDTDSAFEYVMLDDPKPAGFESDELLSGWTYQNISFYREVKDSATHFFINWLPRGTVTLRYTLRPTVSGQLHALPAQVQSMYAPEYGAHSASRSFNVEK
ncbi:MG2 domain-containing protein [Candidatus Avelusimicrobium caledoniensis]|uniref:alpha-2-macroglobulin family protein n=1 Tax=Candidatus Avelusimicrobium caledoniensis TaxID=3416220 RepID=UPI003D0D571A